jgi:hypothetical protein
MIVPIVCHRCRAHPSGKFAAGVVYTGGKLPPSSLTPVTNFAAAIVDTYGKFATGINNTSDIVPLS